MKQNEILLSLCYIYISLSRNLCYLFLFKIAISQILFRNTLRYVQKIIFLEMNSFDVFLKNLTPNFNVISSVGSFIFITGTSENSRCFQMTRQTHSFFYPSPKMSGDSSYSGESLECVNQKHIMYNQK